MGISHDSSNRLLRRFLLEINVCDRIGVEAEVPSAALSLAAVAETPNVLFLASLPFLVRPWVPKKQGQLIHWGWQAQHLEPMVISGAQENVFSSFKIKEKY